MIYIDSRSANSNAVAALLLDLFHRTHYFLDLGKVLRVTFCKTDAPEIHDPLDVLDFWHMCLL